MYGSRLWEAGVAGAFDLMLGHDVILRATSMSDDTRALGIPPSFFSLSSRLGFCWRYALKAFRCLENPRLI